MNNLKSIPHSWIRSPYYGGCSYYCEICGITVSQDYSVNQTELSSGAIDILNNLMDEENKKGCMDNSENEFYLNEQIEFQDPNELEYPYENNPYNHYESWNLNPMRLIHIKAKNIRIGDIIIYNNPRNNFKVADIEFRNKNFDQVILTHENDIDRTSFDPNDFVHVMRKG